MKKLISIVLLLLIVAICVCTFISCDKEESVQYCTVDIYTFSKYTKDKSLLIEKGEVVGDLSRYIPNAEKYTWYTDMNYTNVWDLYRDEVKCDMKLYGKRK